MKNLSSFFPRFSIIVFGFFLLLLCLIYGYHDTIRLKPCSIHQWRQADCWSMATNYYQENLNFLKPSLHFINESETGNTAAELPIIYFTVAKLWKVFGQKAWIFRLVNILIVFAGLAALFKLTEKMLKDSVWALMLTLIFFTSPILVFYTNNFIADAPALGLSLIGFFFFYNFYKKQSLKHLYIACFFFMIGALLKVTAAMLFMSIVVVFLLERIPNFKAHKSRKVFDNPLKQMFPFLMVFIGLFVWYLYASFYNKTYQSAYFLMGILPIWEMKYPLINQISRIINENLIYQFYNIYTFVIVLSMFAYLLIRWEKGNRFLNLIVTLLFAGSVAYLILWYRVFDVHDYYLLNLLIFMALVPLVFFKHIKDNHPELIKNKRFKFVFFLLLTFNVYYAHHKNGIKYENKQERWHYSFLNRTNELEYWGWLHWHYNTYVKAYETVTPYLRSLGIERTDRVISINDHSPNISLALMDVKGVTDFGKSIVTAERVHYEIERGAKYLIVNKPEMLEQDFLQDFILYPMGSYYNIFIYDLRYVRKSRPK